MRSEQDTTQSAPILERVRSRADELMYGSESPRDEVTANLLFEVAVKIQENQVSLETAHQALLEVSHAQDIGANWYTKGESGLYNQVRMWVSRALLAAMQSLGLEEAKPYGLECKKAEWMIDKATFEYFGSEVSFAAAR